MKLLFVSAVGLMALVSCNSSTMTASSYDGRTGKSTATNYSGYYTDGVWISPKQLGLAVSVDQTKRIIPGAHGLQQSLGALGPGDSYAQGNVILNFWNLDRREHSVKILRVVSKGQTLPINQTLKAPAEFISEDINAGVVRVFTYSTEIPVTVEYEWNGKRISKDLTLKRMTTEQMKEFRNPEGKRPYPWYQAADRM